MSYYGEERIMGAWRPRKYADRPVTAKVNGRECIVYSDGGQGREVRAIKEINVGHERLNLDQLRECYSPDGRFRNV